MKDTNETLSDLQSLKSVLMEGVEDVVNEDTSEASKGKQVIKEDVKTEQPAKLCAGKAVAETKEVSENEQEKILDEEKKEKENMKKRIQRIIENRLATRRALRRRYLNEDGEDDEVLDGEDEVLDDGEVAEGDPMQDLCDKLDKIIAALGIDDVEGDEDFGDEEELDAPVEESRRMRRERMIREGRRAARRSDRTLRESRLARRERMIREGRRAACRSDRTLRESRSESRSRRVR